MAKSKKKNNDDLGFDNLKGFIIGSGDVEPSEYIPTGHFRLDFSIIYGDDPTKTNLSAVAGYDPSKPLGLPVGKLVEFYGPEGGGKSSLAYRVVGNAQRMGYTAAWIDAECSFSKQLALINGCNPKDILVVDTKENNMTAEKVLQVIEGLALAPEIKQTVNGKIVKKPRPKVIVLDSLPSLVPLAVQTDSFEQQHVGLLSRLFSAKIGRIAQALAKNDILLIIINQVREKVGIMFGNPENTPGGHAVKHAFSVRLRIARNKSKEARLTRIDESGDEIVIGSHANIRIEKNRFGKPVFHTLEIPIYYEAYFPNIEEVIFDTGRQINLITVYNGTFKWGDMEDRIKGKEKFIEYLKSNNLVSKLISDIKKKATEDNIILPTEIVQYKVKPDKGEK